MRLGSATTSLLIRGEDVLELDERPSIISSEKFAYSIGPRMGDSFCVESIFPYLPLTASRGG